MPLHIDIIGYDTDENINEFLEMVFESIKTNKKYFSANNLIVTSFNIDSYTNNLKNDYQINGVITIKPNNDINEILDIDIVIENENKRNLMFVSNLKGNIPETFFYQVEDVINGGNLIVEAVNSIIHDEIVNNSFEVSLCAFAFYINPFKSIDELNKFHGYPVTVKNEVFPEGHIINGYSKDFSAPSTVLDDTTNYYSMLIGKLLVIDFVNTDFKMIESEFILLVVKTGIGIIPIAINKNQIDLTSLEIGDILEIYCYIKADFAIDEKYYYDKNIEANRKFDA